MYFLYNIFFKSYNVHEIIPNLWLGNSYSAVDKNFFILNDINLVINCTPNVEFIQDNNVEKIRLPIYDSLLEKDLTLMEYYFMYILPILVNKYKENKKILIHCEGGKQRSSILVAALLKLLLDNNTIYIDTIPSNTSPQIQMNNIFNYIISIRPCAFTYGFRINFYSSFINFFKINHKT